MGASSKTNQHHTVPNKNSSQARIPRSHTNKCLTLTCPKSLHLQRTTPLIVLNRAKTEMQSFQNRILRIINITPTNAASKYNIKTIEELLDTTNSNTLKRILADQHHPLTTKLPKLSRTTRTSFRFKKKQSKNNSILQQFPAKVHQDDTRRRLRPIQYPQQPIPTSTFTKSSNKTTPTEVPIPNRTTVKIACSICGKSYAKGASIHLKSCRNKQALLINNFNTHTT